MGHPHHPAWGCLIGTSLAHPVDQAEKMAEGTDLADIIRGPRFKEERLQIGMVAPNIVGEDIDGVKFELHDYRGKVTVLDFWGFW